VPYVDGFVIALPKKNLADYRRLARAAGKIWREHGALDYWECAADEADAKNLKTFQHLIALKRSETVVFSWIEYRSKGHRDRVNAKVMKDPRIAKMMQGKAMPFDTKRMAWSGFRPLVRA
jgi:uncharacterized protein YbaA (DUF1428 family)